VTDDRWRYPRTIGESVLDELGRFGPAGAIGEVVAAWPDAVGAAIAREAWPARIARDGTLHVATSSSVWAYELTQLEETVLERLREALGETTPARLRFAAGRVPETAGEAAPERANEAPPPVPEEARRLGEDVASAIEDEELRALVARAAARSLGRPDDRSL
jgi:hypothetical protein